MIELNLVVLFILFAALFFILMSLFLYLIIKKYMNNRTKQKIKDYKKDYYEDVFQFLQTGEQGLIQFDQKLEKFKAMIELLIEYSTVLDDSSVKMRISNFAKQHLTTYVKKELRKRRWSLRMNALYLIEDFHMDNLVEILHELYKKKRTTVAEKTQILKLLAQFDDEKIVEYVKTVSTQISDFSLLTIMTSLEEEKFEVLIEEFDALPIRIKYIVVETIGRKQLFKHQNLLQRLVLQDEGELRIRALKAYATTGLPIDSNVIAGFFHSENWQIRLMVIKVAGVQRMDEYKERLIELLSDREYIVRAEAAKAILRFKDGVSILTKVTEDSNDVFAKDMAIEWLEKERDGYSY